MGSQFVIQWWHYATFVVAICFVLAFDLGVFHRQAREVRFREALLWTFVWFVLSLVFAASLIPTLGRDDAQKFLLGYILELSLSMDNVFVIALIFAYFRVPVALQHRVLFWGILGAFVMRGIMIGLGAALIARFDWILYLFGVFLVITGVKMVFAGEEGVHPERNLAIRVARRLCPISPEFEGQRFWTRWQGRFALTPLAVVLLMVETTDLVFAVDSIPAIFGITKDPFIVFTSNVFAILGLRSLYFVLVGAIAYFRYLKVGLAVVLVFIGIKMLLDPHAEEPELKAQTGVVASPARRYWFQVELPTSVSLAIVGGILGIAVLSSVAVARIERRSQSRARPEAGGAP